MINTTSIESLERVETSEDTRLGEGLRHNTLPFLETLAQSIANIAPTVTPALAIPLVFASSGNGTWLTYLLATIGLLFVSVCINHFARHSATPGALYTYTERGLGRIGGVISGWGLLLAYIVTAMAVAIGFSIFLTDLMGQIGITGIPIYVFFAVDVALAWFFAYRDIRLSAALMLVTEFTSVSIILLLGVITVISKGVVIDSKQLTLEGTSGDAIRLGLVLAVFSFVGFESATSLGAEAKNPLKSIPRAVLISTASVGIFFVIMSYIEVMAFTGYKTGLESSSAPLTVLAEVAGVSAFGTLTSVMAAISFFACTLACVNAVSRMMMAMSREGKLPAALGRVHPKNETPHVAATVSSAVVLAGPVLLTLFGAAALDAYGYTGTVATYGFLLAYILIAVAAPLHLRRLKILTPKDLVLAILAVLFMALPVFGSVYPVPAYPYNLLPYIFLAYMIIGVGAILLAERLRRPVPQATETAEPVV